MKNWSFLILFLVIVFSSFAQKKLPGYLVTYSGDTLKGLIKKPGVLDPEGICTFYDSTEKKIKIQFENIFGYGYIENNKQSDFQKLKLKGDVFADTTFLEIILKGKISVFMSEYFSKDGTRTTYYLKKDGGNIYTLGFGGVEINKRKTLKKALAECATVIEKIEGPLTKTKVLELVNEYNNCGFF